MCISKNCLFSSRSVLQHEFVAHCLIQTRQFSHALRVQINLWSGFVSFQPRNRCFVFMFIPGAQTRKVGPMVFWSQWKPQILLGLVPRVWRQPTCEFLNTVCCPYLRTIGSRILQSIKKKMLYYRQELFWTYNVDIHTEDSFSDGCSPHAPCCTLASEVLRNTKKSQHQAAHEYVQIILVWLDPKTNNMLCRMRKNLMCSSFTAEEKIVRTKWHAGPRTRDVSETEYMTGNKNHIHFVRIHPPFMTSNCWVEHMKRENSVTTKELN